MPGDIKGLLELGGTALYAKQVIAGGEHLRLLSTDALGALNTNSYAPMVTRRMELNAIDSTLYASGTTIAGTPTNKAALPNVSRANLLGVVIESAVVRLFSTNASPPDLDIYVFNKELGASTVTTAAFPVIPAADWLGFVGVIPIRAASGHWIKIKTTAGATQGHVATVSPFLSFVLNNSATLDNSCYMVTALAADYTFDVAATLDVQFSIRQG